MDLGSSQDSPVESWSRIIHVVPWICTTIYFPEPKNAYKMLVYFYNYAIRQKEHYRSGHIRFHDVNLINEGNGMKKKRQPYVFQIGPFRVNLSALVRTVAESLAEIPVIVALGSLVAKVKVLPVLETSAPPLATIPNIRTPRWTGDSWMSDGTA